MSFLTVDSIIFKKDIFNNFSQCPLSAPPASIRKLEILLYTVKPPYSGHPL